MAEQNSEQESMIGRKLELQHETYVVESLLGKGGMGTVYSGKQLSTDRSIAIKCIEGTTVAGYDEKRNDRFTDEIKNMINARRPRCPNIVKIYDAGKDENNAWMAMEKVEGVDLEEVATFLGGMLDLKEIYTIFKQVSNAIDNGHANGIVHRDLKPSNILVDSIDDIVKLTDFGIAYAQTRGKEKTRHKIDTPGTPDWMSKWQISPPTTVVRRNDPNLTKKEDEWTYVRRGKIQKVIIVDDQDGKTQLQIRDVLPEIDLTILTGQLLFYLVKGWSYFAYGDRNPWDLMIRITKTKGKELDLKTRKVVCNEDRTLKGMKKKTTIQLQHMINKSFEDNIEQTYHTTQEAMRDLEKAMKLQYGRNYQVDEKECIQRMLWKLDEKVIQRCDSLIRGEITQTLSRYIKPGNEYTLSYEHRYKLDTLARDISLVCKKLGNEGKAKRLMHIINLNTEILIQNHEQTGQASKEETEFYLNVLKRLPTYPVKEHEKKLSEIVEKTR